VKLLLDTSAYSALMLGDVKMLELLKMATQVIVPTIVLGELYSGFQQGARRAQNEAQLEQFLNKRSVLVVAATKETARRYAEIDVYLHAKGRPIPRNDVWIAAAAFEHGCTLVTRDEHFRELPLVPIRP
jgi:tRNA(fMet)-specific endonuclease VapC